MTRSLETLRDNFARPDIGFDLVRIFLGVALFVRGVLFIGQPNRLFSMMGRTGDWFWPAAIGHLVAIAHVCGGMLLAVGLATRLAAVVQIPVLLGAVFLVHWNNGLLSSGQSLELASLVLVMLIAYAVFGAGPVSFDYLLHRGERLRENDTSRFVRPRA